MTKQSFSIANLANPEFFVENRLPAHSDHDFYADKAEMVRNVSSFQRTLDGLWYFNYAKNTDLRPSGFEAVDYDCHNWETIRVPAHWQMEGYGVPQYTNVIYPWDGHEAVKPGQIPQKDNPTGSYVKYFVLPAGWENACISFKGAESAMAVWLNGHYVGYSEDSFTPSDFDLTPYLVKGENKLAVQVYRFSSGSWLEDQDFWRFSGLFREVVLYTKPAIHIEDIWAKAKPVNDYQDGELTLAVKWNDSSNKNYLLEVLDNAGKLVHSQKYAADSEKSEIKVEFKDIELWSAEQPNLYQLIITVFTATGSVSEVVTLATGFREFKLDGNIMKLNGKRIVFKGTNRHEFDCYRGRAIDPATFEQDIITMKRHNINALRCSHYPNSSYIYKLCDRYGIYVIDETNLETHGTWQKNGLLAKDENTLPNDHQEWQEIILDRAKSMLERDKNHAAILIWSCGNESCGGKDIYNMSEYFRKTDPSRLVHYESIFWDRRYNATSDMESQMYTKVADIKKFLAEHRDKPFICCEYTHSMGNSNGGMHKYTELTETEPLYQGGFIWDFVDQAIYYKDRYGNDALGYGGDFGDRSCDYNFSGNGILFADRTLTTKLQDVKYNYQNFSLDVAADKVTISNKSLFTNAAEYEMHIELALEGKVIWEKTMPAPSIAPGETKEIALDFLPLSDAGEEAVTVSLRLASDTLWAKRGFEVAFGQGVWEVDELELPAAADALEAFDYGKSTNVLSYSKNAELETKNSNTLTIVQGDMNLGVQGEGFAIMFSSAQGNLISYKYNGVEFIDDMPKPSFWRAPVDNDYGSRRDFALAQWKLASLYRRCVKKELKVDGKWQEVNFYGQLGIKTYTAAEVAVRFTFELATQPVAVCTVTYTVNMEGAIKTELDYEKVAELPELPDFAMLFTLPAEYDRISFYGYGPADNYIDRQEGVKLGIYQTTTQKEVQPYLMPQECGNHGGIRWFAVTDKRGRGLKLYGDVPFEASALPYSAHELENARHANELPCVQHTFLRASLGQCGVGGDDTWGAPVLEEYRVQNEKKHFEFYIKGI